MLYTKACPRCRGDIKLDRDSYGVYAKCLQCGFNRDFLSKRTHSPSVAPGDQTLPGEPAVQHDGEQREAA